MELLGIVHDTLRTVRMVKESKDVALTMSLGIKDLPEALRRLATLLNTYNPAELRQIAISTIEFVFYEKVFAKMAICRYSARNAAAAADRESAASRAFADPLSHGLPGHSQQCLPAGSLLSAAWSENACQFQDQRPTPEADGSDDHSSRPDLTC
jgi:hypothetical protein